MKNWIKRSTWSSLIALTMLMPLQLAASEPIEQLNEARMEGQISMAYALSEHLSVFDLDVEVNRSEAILSGRVEEDVQKDLAEEVALGLEGIDSVDNRIKIGDASSRKSNGDDADDGFRATVSDATTTATVKSKLLWNRNTSGLAIDVSTENGAVSLEGEADSEASKALAERLATNTDGVHSVKNRIRVSNESGTGEESRGIDDVVSDSWITTKVRSTLIFTSNVPARSIGIDTKDGVVTLEGEVDNAATRQLAIELASDIRGVREVDAENLRAAQS